MSPTVPGGQKGKWFEFVTGAEVDVDPATLPPNERKRYRYGGPEVIYTFWAKHGQCVRPECNHRTPIFRSPIIAEKRLGVKYVECTCKKCKTTFHAELGSARMAPAAQRVVLDNEPPFTELSQAFAKELLDYGKGDAQAKFKRVNRLCGMVEKEEGLKCPFCGEFAGQWLRDVMNSHKDKDASAIDKKDLRNSAATQQHQTHLLLAADPPRLAERLA